MSPYEDTIIDILLSTYEGGPWIDEFLRSLAAQTHTAWRLWTIDDGSHDDTVARVARAAQADPRIRVMTGHLPGRGAAAAFAWLWNQLPEEVALIAFADQDDIWHPEKLARSVTVLRAAEGAGSTPVLVHTDLEVVDAALHPIAPSLRRYADLRTEPRPLRRVIGANSVTGCTILCNAALYRRVGQMPEGLAMHDWWVAAVAAAFGRTVYLDQPSVRYRQHGRNAVGARATWAIKADVVIDVIRRLGRPDPRVRSDLDRASTQAAAFLKRFGTELSAADRLMLVRWEAVRDQRGMRRLGTLLRLYWPPERGLWHLLAHIWQGR